jgi:hypothetical protein
MTNHGFERLEFQIYGFLEKLPKWCTRPKKNMGRRRGGMLKPSIRDGPYGRWAFESWWLSWDLDIHILGLHFIFALFFTYSFLLKFYGKRQFRQELRVLSSVKLISCNY